MGCTEGAPAAEEWMHLPVMKNSHRPPKANIQKIVHVKSDAAPCDEAQIFPGLKVDDCVVSFEVLKEPTGPDIVKSTDHEKTSVVENKDALGESDLEHDSPILTVPILTTKLFRQSPTSLEKRSMDSIGAYWDATPRKCCPRRRKPSAAGEMVFKPPPCSEADASWKMLNRHAFMSLPKMRKRNRHREMSVFRLERC